MRKRRIDATLATIIKVADAHKSLHMARPHGTTTWHDMA
jgi:hypothetical protein